MTMLHPVFTTPSFPPSSPLASHTPIPPGVCAPLGVARTPIWSQWPSVAGGHVPRGEFFFLKTSLGEAC